MTKQCCTHYITIELASKTITIHLYIGADAGSMNFSLLFFKSKLMRYVELFPVLQQPQFLEPKHQQHQYNVWASSH